MIKLVISFSSSFFVLWGGWGERKREHVCNDGKREERPLPYNVPFSGLICGSVVLAKPANYLDDFECCCEDNSRKGSIRNLMEFPFCFTDFLRFMFLELSSAILDNHVQSCQL